MPFLIRCLTWALECAVREDWRSQSGHLHQGDVRHHQGAVGRPALRRCEAGIASQRRANVAHSPGGGPQIQQLRVRGAHSGLEGAKGLDQGSRCEPHDAIQAA